MSGGRELDTELSGAGPHQDVPVRFCGGPAVSVCGPVTERIYRFSHENPVQTIDARDAASIVKTGLFRQVL